MTIEQFNCLHINQAQELLFNCCGSTLWSKELVEYRPFNSVNELKTNSDKIWLRCGEKDWMEAFSHHPKIGDIKSLAEKFATTKEWASNEQSGVDEASSLILQKLSQGNNLYEEKFGYIFIVCATGKSASEMLSLLESRLKNTPEVEIIIAMLEQNKITHLRIDKLFS